MQAIVISGLLLLLVAGFLMVLWIKARRTLREAKNIERGLKMVPMLIHLPPSSEDIEGGNRDTRDVTEETISKAQSLYDIISSTAQKGFKSKFYGQRHIAFEIVGLKGMVYFYAAVPVAMVEIVKQAVISSYPSARLEEVTEHNIFSPVGKITGTIGGELVLKEQYVYPIATFEETKRDAMQSILNSLSDLGPDDGVGIQLLLRPAKQGWDKVAKDKAKKKREGKDKKKGGVASFVKQLFEALWKPPDASSGGKEDSTIKPLGALEQSTIDAIEEKTRHAAYETLIRVITSANLASRAQTILRNIVATFALFDAPGKNGFKFNEARDIENFVTAYIMRFFPPELDKNILNSVELSTIFHFPDERLTPTSQLSRQASKQVDGPRNIPANGIILGHNIFRGIKREVRVSEEDKHRHIYIVGQTGTGKTTFLGNMILQDMLSGQGLCFIDPHGDQIDLLMGMVPRERIEDVIYFSPAEMDYPMGLNMFEFHTPEQKDFLIQEAIAMLYRLYDPQHQGIVGPRYEHWFRNAALTVMSDPNGSSFIDIPKVFTDNNYAKQKLKYVTDQTVLDFWNKEMASTSDYHKSEVLGWFVSKFGAFLSNEMMRNVIGQTKSAFDLRQVMDEGKILFVNLSKGRTGELNSKLLGMIFVMKFQAAAMSRASIPEDQRRTFSLYVDEFQNFSTDSFAAILSEARKYKLNLIVGNQFIGQLTDEIRDAVFGNVGTVISYRVGVSDAEFLAKQFSPTFDVDDLVKLPNFNTIIRLMIDNIPSRPFSMTVPPPLGHYNAELAAGLKRLAIAKYGKPKKIVEEEIFKRLRTEEPPAPRYGAMAGPLGRPMPPSVPTTSTGTGTSFLDEWLAKRRAEMVKKAKGEGGDGRSVRERGPMPAAPQQAGPVDWTEDEEDGPDAKDDDWLEPVQKKALPTPKPAVDATELLLRPKKATKAPNDKDPDPDLAISIDADGTIHQSEDE